MAATKPPQIKPLGAVPFVHMALVAKSGFGKTVFGGTAPKALFLTTDPEGTISAHELGSKAEEWKIKSWAEFKEAYIWLRDGGCALYDWVIIDNITEAQNLGMKEAMEIAVQRNEKRDPYVPDKYEYQRTQNAILDIVRMFHDLPVNILWTVHRKGMEDGDGAEYYSAAIQGQQGQIAETILGYCNIVAMGEVKEKDGKQVRRFYFTHTGPYRGKDRFVKLGNYKDDLTIPKMMQILQGRTVAAKAGPGRPIQKAAAVKRVAAKKTAAKRTAAR